MLYLQHDLYNIILKMKHKLYITSGSAPPPPERKILGARTTLVVLFGKDVVRKLPHRSDGGLARNTQPIDRITGLSFQRNPSPCLRSNGNFRDATHKTGPV
jgi:hypothetical protein